MIDSSHIPQVSTLAAVTSGNASIEGNDNIEDLISVEHTIKRRFPVGSRVSEARILADFSRQVRTGFFMMILNIFIR